MGIILERIYKIYYFIFLNENADKKLFVRGLVGKSQSFFFVLLFKQKGLMGDLFLFMFNYF